MKNVNRPKYIGGFFELELMDGGNTYHRHAIPLTNGRACLSLIIKKTKPEKCFVPYYSCDALYEPIKNSCKYEFFSIDNKLEIIDVPDLGDREYLVYINYFGLKSHYIEELKLKLGKNILCIILMTLYHL